MSVNDCLTGFYTGKNVVDITPKVGSGNLKRWESF